MDHSTQLRRVLNNYVELNDIEFDIIARELTYKKAKPKEVLIKEGEVKNTLFFLVTGAIRMWKDVNGKEITFNIFSHQRFVANMKGITKELPSDFCFQAVIESELYCLDSTQMKKLFDLSPRFERIGRLMLEDILSEEIERTTEILFLDNKGKYEALLKKSPDIIPQIPQKIIASYLGISPESFSRLKRKLFKVNTST